jgi:hypothetical protein
LSAHTHRLRLGKLTVTIRDGASPREYKVLVVHGRARYNTRTAAGDGSVGDRAAVGAAVVENLFAAAEDPDAFVTSAVDDAHGREALKRGKAAEKTVKGARKFNYNVLVDAVDAARERGLL